MEIKLLGRPAVIGLDGEVPLRGRKTWAVLARVLLGEGEPTRRLLASSIFPDADDPMGALRWALGQIRATIGSPVSFRGDPVDANLPPGISVDVLELVSGHATVDESTGTLLEGIESSWGPEFDAWVAVERLSIEARTFAALRSDALRALATNQAPRAITCARSMIERAPFEEAGHILLIKALVAGGDTGAAQERAAACETLFRAELGVEPTAAVRSASRPSAAAPVPGVSASATVRSLLESGGAALDAGAPDAGLECLRQAVSMAAGCGSSRLEATALAALGSALVHAVRGFDDEGAVALAQAVELAVAEGDGALAADALTELGYVDVLAGRRTQAEESLRRAGEAATGRADLLAGITAIAALNLADRGQARAAADEFRTSLAHGETAGEPRRIAFTLGLGARTLLELELHEEAAAWIERSLRLIAEERWMSFRPWVEVLGYEQDLALERPTAEVRAGLEQTFALSVRLNDPCWEGVAARTIGSTCARAGEVDDAFAWFADARTRCTRVTDTYVWVEASALQREAELAHRIGDAARCAAASSDLLSHSVRCQLDGFADTARRLTT